MRLSKLLAVDFRRDVEGSLSEHFFPIASTMVGGGDVGNPLGQESSHSN